MFDRIVCKKNYSGEKNFTKENEIKVTRKISLEQ
jgi:hypothetical protein